jgi:acyl-coenzyme A synthetase/AMP-(fatty) acid ligase
MIPEIIEFLEDLPKTSTGKIDRVRLLETVPA